MADRILPTYQSVGPREMQEAIGQAIGAASACWESMEGTGVFQEQRASQLAGELTWIAGQFARDTRGALDRHDH